MVGVLQPPVPEITPEDLHHVGEETKGGNGLPHHTPGQGVERIADV